MTPKFRAWDVHEKRMLKVYRLSFDGPIEGVQVHCYLDDRDAEGSTEYSYDGDGLILEQSTGLKDTNGKEIYEGDLVRLTDDLEDPIYKVIFDEAKFEIIGGGVCYDLGEEFMDCEVIGNMHTDGDLIDS